MLGCHPQRLTDYDAPRPDTDPLTKHRDPVNACIKAFQEALLRLILIASQQEREHVQALHIFDEDLAKVLTGRELVVSARRTAMRI
jgi:hypothetical protein